MKQNRIKALAAQIALELQQNKEQINPILFEDFCKIYLEKHAERKRTYRLDEGRIRNHLLPAFRGRILASISRSEVFEMHSKVKQSLVTPVTSL